MTEMDPNNGKVDREFQLISVVGVLDSAKMGQRANIDQVAIESIEAEMGQTIRVGQLASNMGNGFALEIQRQRLDILVVGERMEVRSQEGSFSPEIANDMARFLDLTVAKFGTLPWLQVGFNFILPLRSSARAIGNIAQVFLKEDLGTTLGYPITGAATWLWLEIEEGTLWLKLQPLRDSVTTNTIIANANVTITFDQQPDFPGSNEVSRRLWHYWGQLDTVLRATEL